MGVHGRSESIYGVEDTSMKNEPGTSYANNGVAYIVLEDGSTTEIHDATYRTLMKMLSENKIYTESILNNIPEEQGNLFIKGDIAIDDFYSVHDIMLEIEHDVNGNVFYLQKKRISFATFGTDTIFNDSWRINSDGNPKTAVSLDTIFNKLMTASFTLDEYFDKSGSNIGLLMKDGSLSISTIVLRLRKMNNPVSATSEDAYVNVLMTGLAALEVLSKLNTDLTALRFFSKINIENIYSDGTLESNVVTFGSNEDTLKFIFDSYNNDTSVVVDDATDTISFQHRNFGVMSVDNTYQENAIYMIKSIIMNSNGHINTLSKTDLEVSKEMNYLFYTKAQVSSQYLSRVNTGIQVLNGSISVDDLLVENAVDLKGGYEVDGDVVLLNSVNTSVKDPIITVGAGNTDSSAEDIGMVFNLYKAADTWDDNVLTNAALTSGGGTFGFSSNILSVVISAADAKEYLPDYYTSDSALNTDYYVSDAYLELKPAKMNMLLALASSNKVLYTEATNYYTKLRMFINNVLNGSSSDIDVQVILQYKFKSSLDYVDVSTHNISYQDPVLQNMTTYNSYDVDKIRLRIFTKLKKTAVTAMGDKSFIFHIQQMGIFGYGIDEVKLDSSNSPAYSNRYYSEDSSVTADYLKLTNGTQPRSYTSLNDVSVTGVYCEVDSNNIVSYNGVDKHALIIETSVGDSNFIEDDSNMKLVRIRGLFTPSGASYQTAAESIARSVASINPSMTNYIPVLKVYACMYSDLIFSLGSSTTETDAFGRVTTTEVQTVVREIVLDDTTLINTKTLSFTQLSTYASIDEYLELDMTTFVSRAKNKIEYFTGKYRNDTIQLAFRIELIKNPVLELYNSYGDQILIEKFFINAFDILKEFRGTARDVVVDETVYNDVPSMFLDSQWEAEKNILEDATLLTSAGVTNTSFNTDNIVFSVNKTGGASYSMYGWTDVTDSYDQRTYMTAFKFKKSTNNLFKVELFLKDIVANTVTIDSLADVKVYAALFSVDSSGTYSAMSVYSNDRISGDSVAVVDLIPASALSTGNKPIAEMRRLASFITANSNSSKLVEFGVNENILLHYDLNNYDDTVTLELDVFIDIPVNGKYNIQSLDVVFSKLSVRAMTNLPYKMRYTYEQSSSQAIAYNTSKNAIRMIENKFDSENNALNISHLSDFEMGNFKGLVENVQGFNTDLNIEFSKHVKGSFMIGSTNTITKRVPMSIQDASASDYGIVGLLGTFDKTVSASDIPSGSVYSGQAMYNTMSFLARLHYKKDVSITNSDDSYIATSRAINNLYKYYQEQVAAVQSVWLTESAALKVANTITQDLIHFDPWDLVSTLGGISTGTHMIQATTYYDATSNSTVKNLSLSTSILSSIVLRTFTPDALLLSAPQAVSTSYDNYTSAYPSYTLVRWALAGYSGTLSIAYTQYSKLMNMQKAADPYFLYKGKERRDGDNLYVCRLGMIGGSIYSPNYANNGAYGEVLVSSNVIFDSENVGQLKQLYFPEYTTSDYVEYIYSKSPRLEALSSSYRGDVDYVNQTCGDNFALSYQSFMASGSNARAYMYGGVTEGGGRSCMMFVPPFYTWFQLVIQVSGNDGLTWSDVMSKKSRFFSLESYTVKNNISDYISCDITKRYRIVLNISHQALDIDTYGNPMTVGRMGELNGGFGESRWVKFDDVPKRVGTRLGSDGYHSGKNFFRRLRVTYVKYYLEPWDQPSEYVNTDTVATSGFSAYNRYVMPSGSILRTAGKSDIGVVLASDATDYMRRTYGVTRVNPNIYNYYSFGGGSYWLDDGYYNVPFGTSKIVTIPTQQLTNVMFQYAGDPDFWSSFNVVITLKRHSAHPKTNAEAEAWGTTIRSWAFTMSQCRSINLNSSIIADVDQDLTIDANYRYFYHIKYGKNGVTVGGVNLAGQAAIVRKRDSWDARSYAFYPFSMRLKYYFWK